MEWYGMEEKDKELDTIAQNFIKWNGGKGSGREQMSEV